MWPCNGSNIKLKNELKKKQNKWANNEKFIKFVNKQQTNLKYQT